MIKDFKEGDSGTIVLLCIDKSMAKTKNFKDYVNLSLRDRTGIIDAKIWDLGPYIGEFEKGDFVSVQYTVGSYNNALQLTISILQRVPRESVNADDFCARTELDVEKMWECTLDILSKVEDRWYVELLNKFVKDEDWVREFKQHAAAVKVHHAFIGGLLQHTLFVMRLCVSYAKIYHLDYDLLITAAFLHDVGKLNEINEFPVNDYSEIGQMIGHVSEGAFIVRQACSEIEGFPEYKVNNLVHCILSHHGQLEFGSPKVPCIAEAIALHFADNTDSKLEIALEDGGKTDQWNRYLGTYVLPTERGE